jgi:hypothetical protein
LFKALAHVGPIITVILPDAIFNFRIRQLYVSDMYKLDSVESKHRAVGVFICCVSVVPPSPSCGPNTVPFGLPGGHFIIR